MKKLSFLLLILSALVFGYVAPASAQAYDWSYNFDFIQSDYCFNVISGSYARGIGLTFVENDPGVSWGELITNMQYDRDVYPKLVIITFSEAGDGIGLGEPFVLSANYDIFGLHGTTFQAYNASQRTLTLAPDFATDHGSAINLAMQYDMDTAHQFFIHNIQIFGNGVSPFLERPTPFDWSDCADAATPTPTPTPPPPTNTLPPPSATLTPSQTLTPSNTPSPTLTPTASNTPSSTCNTLYNDWDSHNDFAYSVTGGTYNTPFLGTGESGNGWHSDAGFDGTWYTGSYRVKLTTNPSWTINKWYLNVQDTFPNVDLDAGYFYKQVGSSEVQVQFFHSNSNWRLSWDDGAQMRVAGGGNTNLNITNVEYVGFYRNARGSSQANADTLFDAFTVEMCGVLSTPTATPTMTGTSTATATRTPNPFATATRTPLPSPGTPATASPTFTPTETRRPILPPPTYTAPPLATLPPPGTPFPTVTPFPTYTPMMTSTTGTPIATSTAYYIPWATLTGIPSEAQSGIAGMAGGVLSGVSNAMSQALNYAGQMGTALGKFNSAWKSATPRAIPGLPNCSTQHRLESELCAIYYILQYTVFSGTVGSFILPAATVVVDLAVLLGFIKRARAILSRLKGITEV